MPYFPRPVAPGGAGLTYTTETITTGNVLGNGGTYNESVTFATAVVIEGATILRTAGTSTTVAVSIFDGDPDLAGEQISALLGEPFSGVNASTLVTGPQTESGGVKSRMTIPLTAGTYWLQVKNDPGFAGVDGTYTVTIKHRSAE